MRLHFLSVATCDVPGIKAEDGQGVFLERVSQEKHLKCSNCSKCFFDNTTLKKHLRIHMEKKPFRSLECGKALCNSNKLSIHERIHTGVKPFKCLECGKAFSHSCSVFHSKVFISFHFIYYIFIPPNSRSSLGG